VAKIDITRPFLALLAASVLSSCTRPPDYLYVDPRAQPLRVQLRKAFGSMSPQYAPVAIGECVFYEAPPVGAAASAEPTPPAQEIWRVISVAPDRPATEIRYGVLPPGFLQAAPSAGMPAPLLPGHHYTVECSGDAIGSSEFVIPEVATRRRDDRRKPESRP
jgi:hypothetical protein